MSGETTATRESAISQSASGAAAPRPANDATLSGRVWVFGDNIDTDVIIPARYLLTADPVILSPHCMEDIDATFAAKVQPGDIIVAGSNFGCGSSREHAPIAIKGVGISAVIATSFANIFYRNAINIGLPIFECPEAIGAIQQGDTAEVDLANGRITDTTSGQSFQAQPYPESILRIIRAGGLVAATREKIAASRQGETPASE